MEANDSNPSPTSEDTSNQVWKLPSPEEALTQYKNDPNDYSAWNLLSNIREYGHNLTQIEERMVKETVPLTVIAATALSLFITCVVGALAWPTTVIVILGIIALSAITTTIKIIVEGRQAMAREYQDGQIKDMTQRNLINFYKANKDELDNIPL